MKYDKANRLIEYNGEEVRYDADGNMVYGPVDGRMTELEYDCRNRLIKAGDITYEYKTEEEVKAPVAENQTLGEICIYSNGALIKSVKLYSSKAIMKISFNYIFKEMLRNI